MTGSDPRITLVGKPGCHLCDEARTVIERVCAETGERFGEVSIYDDLEMADLYWELIPVTLVDGVQLSTCRVDAQELRAALAVPRPA